MDLGSTTTNSHGVALLNFATESGYDQLVIILMNIEQLLTS